MAADDEDTGDSTPSPEERIAKLEKGNKMSLILIILLAVFSMLQMASIGYLMMAPQDDNSDMYKSEFMAINAQLTTLENARKNAEQIIVNNRVLEEKIEQVLDKANIENFANLRKMLAEQENNHVDFINALQQGMYELSRMVRGSRTWYEIYQEELDKVVEDSKARSAKLAMMAPNK